MTTNTACSITKTYLSPCSFLNENYRATRSNLLRSGPAWCWWWSWQKFACKARGKILHLAILVVRRHSHCISASNWELPLPSCLSLAILNVSLMRTDLRSHIPCQILLQQFMGTRPHKSQMHNYVSTLVENGLTMAGPAGLVPAPMNYTPGTYIVHRQLMWTWITITKKS